MMLFSCFDYGKPCYSSPAFDLAISRFKKKKGKENEDGVE